MEDPLIVRRLALVILTLGLVAGQDSKISIGQLDYPLRMPDTITQWNAITKHCFTPNGIPVEDTHSARRCFNELLKVPVDLPDNVVLGSQSAEVTVTGDIMGKPLENVNNLVQPPKGYGEQNMMILAAIISIISYYSVKGQLTDEILEEAKGLMETGFQSQLNYKHKDGSYSAFGDIDQSGSTWLTAFVAQSFSRCKKFIDIEDKQITDPLDWLKKQQLSNGCFKNVGQVFHQEIQGGEDNEISRSAYIISAFLVGDPQYEGADNEISLSAYIISTFLEVGDRQYNDVIEKAKQCLERCTKPDSSTYTKALCACTYTRLGDSEKRKQLLEQLDQVAIKKDHTTHWTKNSEIPQDNPLWPKPNAADVETTAYAVLAYVSGDKPTKTDLQAAAPAVNWFATRQNSNGGFASIQDTVVALQALSTYDSSTFVAENKPTVTITNDKGFHVDVTVNPQKPEEVQVVNTLEGSGRSGYANVQVINRSNVLNPRPEGTFALVVKTSPLECPPYPEPSFSIDITVSLSSASEIEESNMTNIVIKMMSGFVPVDKNQVLSNSSVKKVKIDPTGVTIYLKKIDSTPIEISLKVKQQSEAQNLQSAVVYVNDFYTPCPDMGICGIFGEYTSSRVV